MANELQIFNNDLFGEVRFVKVEGKEYAVASDVAKVLGYKRPNDAITQHCKSVTKHRIATSQGNMSEMNLIPEGDIYRLIIRSKLPQAQQFESWVMDEVLPQMRQTGGAVVEGREEEFIHNYFPSFSEDVKKAMVLDLHKQNKEFKETIQEMQPKVEYHDTVLTSTNAVNISNIAKDYGISAKKLNKILEEQKVQYRVGGQWVLYAKWQDKGFTKSVTSIDQKGEAYIHTRWTQQGRLFIHDILSSLGISSVGKIEGLMK